MKQRRLIAYTRPFGEKNAEFCRGSLACPYGKATGLVKSGETLDQKVELVIRALKNMAFEWA
jgi:hypothetical protein